MSSPLRIHDGIEGDFVGEVVDRRSATKQCCRDLSVSASRRGADRIPLSNDSSNVQFDLGKKSKEY